MTRNKIVKITTIIKKMSHSIIMLKAQTIKLWGEIHTIEGLEENMMHKNILRELQLHVNSKILNLLRDSDVQIEYTNNILSKFLPKNTHNTNNDKINKRRK